MTGAKRAKRSSLRALALVAAATAGCHDPPDGRGARARAVVPSGAASAPPAIVASAPRASSDPLGDAAPHAGLAPLTQAALPRRAPALAAVLEGLQLSYEPKLDRAGRLEDLQRKKALALEQMGIADVSAIRAEAVAAWKRANVVHTWQAVSQLVTVDGDPGAVDLVVRVWVPHGARRVAVFVGDQPSWVENPKQNLPRPSGPFWFSERLADVNDKARYEPKTLRITTYARHAPFVLLLFEHVFREGHYEVERRVPILIVRSGEDCYSAERTSGSVRAEGLSFRARYGSDFAHDVQRAEYASYGDLVKGCHVFRSNHRLGCALDVNNIDFYQSKDGATNPVTASVRHGDRDRMHSLDARNLPTWFYEAAQSLGYRVPTQWLYDGARRDWTHLDLGR